MVNELHDMLEELDEQHKYLADVKNYNQQMAKSLMPLYKSAAFEVFLGTIRRDLEGVMAEQAAVPSEMGFSPKLFECRVLIAYQNELLTRVESYIKEAQASEIEKAKEGDTEE